MIKKEYYCDACGKFIVEEQKRLDCDIYGDDYIVAGDPIGKINYNLLVQPFKINKEFKHFQRRLTGTIILCPDCAFEIAKTLRLLKKGEYEEEDE